MKLNRSLRRICLRKTLAVITSVSMVWSLVPAVPVHATTEERWSDAIDAMLASGEYADGEAVVALLGDEDHALAAQAELPVDDFEPLMEVSGQAVGMAEGDGLVAQSADEVTLSLVSSDSLSTEEILRSLANNPRVAFAEPNYYAELAEEDGVEAIATATAELTVGYAVEDEVAELDVVADGADETLVAADGEALEASEQQSEAEATEPLSFSSIVPQANGVVNDLRPLQWGNWDTTAQGMRSPSTTGNWSVNVPDFDTPVVGANMENEVVVAVLDGAVHFTNPDLADRAYTFSPELQAELGCDVHGFNASAESEDGKLVYHSNFSTDGHGTHCAGIIGASWDGRGISGVASKARIVSVQMAGTRTEGENGKTSLGNGLRAFGFVKRANEAGVGIQVTSSSWGFDQTSKALNAAMYEVGQKQGVVSVLAASNSARNNDTDPYMTSSYKDNPYVITVAATDQFDGLASFSNYGAMTVELAAPGVDILSTATEGDSMYIPGAAGSDILLEDFESDTPAVTVQQIDNDGNLVSEPATITAQTHLTGEHGVMVPIDPKYNIGESSWFPIYTKGIRLDFDLAKVQAQTGVDVVRALASAEDLYVGFGLTTDRDCQFATLDYVKSNMTGGEELPSGGKGGVSNGSITSAFAPLAAGDVERNVDGLNGHLVVDLFITADENTSRIYLDTIAIGTEKVPYVYKSGTSMACPMVSGATAVLASQSGLTGAELASLVRSKIRIPDAGALPVRTGGVFDFNMQGSPDGGENALAPAITSMKVEGATVTFAGSNFGTKPGSIGLSRYVVAKDGMPVEAEVSSWTDSEVVLILAEPFTGILCATIANAAGKHDNAIKFVSKGETVFEQDLPFASDTGEPFMFDGLGDFETRGPLVGLGCKLYYLPAEQPVEESPAYQSMLCFDLKTEAWSAAPSLPEPLQGVSAVMYDGKLVVEGATMQVLPSGEPTLEFVGDEEVEERVYVYDPAASAWSRASNEGMIEGQTIVNNDGKLMLVGGLLMTTAPDDPSYKYSSPAPAYSYNLSGGAIEELYPVYGLMKNPQALARTGNLYLYNPKSYEMSLVIDGKPSMNYDMLPTPANDTRDSYSSEQEVVDPFLGWGVLMNATDGIIFVGPPAADGSSETYILRDGAEKFVPYEKRASEDRVYNPAACTYRGRLFVIGSSWFEPGTRLFRATAMDVPEYPGDIPCEKDPAPEPTPAPVTPSKPTKDATKTASASKSVAKSTSKALPKTGDDAVGVAFIAAAGTLALWLGLTERKRKAQA